MRPPGKLSEPISRARHTASASVEYMGIGHRDTDIVMTKQFLYRKRYGRVFQSETRCVRKPRTEIFQERGVLAPDVEGQGVDRSLVAGTADLDRQFRIGRAKVA